jgi:uncharacterized protein YjiK
MGVSFWVLPVVWLLSSGAPALVRPDLPVRSVIKLDIDEPSDVCMVADGAGFFVVSDKGRLYRVSTDGELIKRKRFKGYDLEGICLLRDTLWAVDETQRRVLAFDPNTLDLLKQRQYTVSGALNEGWEAMCPEIGGEGLVLFTEKMPVRVFRFGPGWELELDRKLKFPKEVSGACIWQGAYWVVSDENRTIYRLDPENFAVLGQWRIPVLNPEGIVISSAGELWILSDDMHRLYQFDLPQ